MEQKTNKQTDKQTTPQPTQWEKIFVNNLSDERLVSRMYKEFLQLNSINETKQADLKMGKTLGLIFIQRRYVDGQYHIKKCPTSLTVREIQMKATIKAIGCLLPNKQKITTVDKGVENQNPYAVGGNEE